MTSDPCKSWGSDSESNSHVQKLSSWNMATGTILRLDADPGYHFGPVPLTGYVLKSRGGNLLIELYGTN